MWTHDGATNSMIQDMPLGLLLDWNRTPCRRWFGILVHGGGSCSSSFNRSSIVNMLLLPAAVKVENNWVGETIFGLMDTSWCLQ
jgi:hypothetical protein